MSAQKTMKRFNANTGKSIGELTGEIEQSILSHCWRQADVCPACGNESALLLGPEHDGDRYVVVPDCEICDAVVAQLFSRREE